MMQTDLLTPLKLKDPLIRCQNFRTFRSQLAVTKIFDSASDVNELNLQSKHIRF